jgi:hypothetical protein
VGTILKTATIQLTDTTILLTLQNETQKEQMGLVRQEFINELRSRLRNTALALELALSEVESQSKAFKPMDIFKAMSERNPALLELKKRFDLEIDY